MTSFDVPTRTDARRLFEVFPVRNFSACILLDRLFRITEFKRMAGSFPAFAILLLLCSLAFPLAAHGSDDIASSVAEITENSAKQTISISLTFQPVTTLGDAANKDLTDALAQFFVGKSRCAHFKTPKTVDFTKAKQTATEKKKEKYTVSCEIPLSAVANAKPEQTSRTYEALEKYFSASPGTSARDFRSGCLHDLRVAEAVFLERAETDKTKDETEKMIRDAFAAFEKNVNENDDLFLSEKEDLLAKAKSVREFLMKKLSAAETETGSAAGPDASAEKTGKEDLPSGISKAVIEPEFLPVLKRTPALLSAGGCQAVQMPDGNVYLISVGNAPVNDDSAKDRILREKIAEQNAYGELAKMINIEITVFEQHSLTEVSNSKQADFQESFKAKKTLRAAEYISGLPTVGTWYSADGKIFFLAKGRKLNPGDIQP